MKRHWIECTRRLEFDAGHRVVGHETKCKHLHGHRYAVEITCRLGGAETDRLGRVVDFGVVKREVGEWIDQKLDHGLILWRQDPMVPTMNLLLVDVDNDLRGYQAGVTQKLYLMDANPTAENLAAHLLDVAEGLLPQEVFVIKVRVWETPNCYADASRGGIV